MRSSTRAVRAPDSEVSTSIARHSRVASSTTFSVRKTRPFDSVSRMKSIDHWTFAAMGTTRGRRLAWATRLRFLRRTAKPSSRYTR